MGTIVLLTGAGGTGKTTLAEAISKQHGLPLVKSISREVMAKHGIAREDDQLKMTDQARWEMQVDIQNAYWDSVKDLDNYVADRTALDHLCYVLMKSWQKLDIDLMEELEDRVFDQFSAATLIIHTPTGIFVPPPDEGPGARTSDPVQREFFDRICKGYLMKHRSHINWFTMTPSDQATRMKHVYHSLVNVFAECIPDTEETRRLRKE